MNGRTVNSLASDPLGAFSIMDYKERLRPKGAPFSGLRYRYIKGWGYHELKKRKELSLQEDCKLGI